jgi:protein TonB
MPKFGFEFGQGGFGDGIAVEFDAAGFGLNMEDFGFDVTQVDKAPRAIRRVNPVYPFSAKRRGVRATVTIRCLVDKDGNPQKIVAAECDPEDAIDIFGPPAVAAVQKWRFSPGEIGGDPVPTRVAFRIIFELES